MKNMIPESIILRQTEDDYLIAEGDIELLETIRDIIKITNSQKLAKNIMNTTKTDETVSFYINKQAAYNHKFNILDESLSALGDIEVIAKTHNNPDDIIEWLTTDDD
ncbi:hypothetical protein [Methanosphaera cuniculi]|uniref:hypothetical protein n=1 Tax=Methanosphaera cuniculi TaxID=1077256 RepID=UPI001FE717D8|nr:hypothetical protein [Methanosphaera cuniculi]